MLDEHELFIIVEELQDTQESKQVYGRLLQNRSALYVYDVERCPFHE